MNHRHQHRERDICWEP